MTNGKKPIAAGLLEWVDGKLANPHCFPWLVVYLTIISTVAVVILASTILPPRHYDADYEQKFRTKDLPKKTGGKEAGEIDREYIRSLFNDRLKTYRDRLDSFLTNVKLVASFIILTVVLLTVQSDPCEIPLIKLSLPRRWVLPVVPVFLLYLWAQFGFLLDSLIGLRVALWHLAAPWELETGAAPYLYSLRPLLDDTGFVDIWFIAFVDPKYVSPQDRHFLDFVVLYSILGGYLSVYGVATGAIFALLFEMPKYFPATRSTRAIFLAITVILFAFLLGSHLAFVYGGGNPNAWAQIVIAVSACASLLFFHWLAAQFQSTRTPAASSAMPPTDSGGMPPEYA
jgi:hypothetical protein